METSKLVVIVGAGGFGREVLWLIRECNEYAHGESGKPFYTVAGFVTNVAMKNTTLICDVPYLGTYDWLLRHRDAYVVCAIGNSRTRVTVIQELSKLGVQFTSLLHPSVRMSQYVEIGEGSIVCAGAVLTTQIKVGKHVHINLNSTIGHDVNIGDFATIAPGANISGNVNIGQCCEVGSNSSVVQGLKLGNGATIGAGAVVTKDVEENTIVVGVPARPLIK